MTDGGLDGTLMPEVTNGNALVIAAADGHSRTVKSWLLSRLLRDFDARCDDEMRHEQPHAIIPTSEQRLEKAPSKSSATAGATSTSRAKPWEALRVSVFQFNQNPPTAHAVPTLDWLWYSGFFVILLQLVIAMLPWVLNREWATFLITAAGNALALIHAALPQWNEEKWACPQNGGSTITLTQGNGSRHAVVILGNKGRGKGLDLSILAKATRTSRPHLSTRIAIAILTLLWIVLLITVAGLQDNSWCQ